MSTAAGRIGERGVVKLNGKLKSLVDNSGESVVTDIETFKNLLTKVQAGDNAGVLLRGRRSGIRHVKFF